MKIKTLFFPLILAVVNFGCLNNLSNLFPSSDSNYPASSASDYPEITKSLEEMKNKYKVSPKQAEKRCLAITKETDEIMDFLLKAKAQGKGEEDIPDSIVKKMSKFDALDAEEEGAMCYIAIEHKILSQDLNGAKKIANKNCAMLEKMNVGFDCKELYEEMCRSGHADFCEMKKALGY